MSTENVEIATHFAINFKEIWLTFLTSIPIDAFQLRIETMYRFYTCTVICKKHFLRGRGFNNQFHIWHFAGAWIQKSVSHWVFCGGVDSKISFTFGILPGRWFKNQFHIWHFGCMRCALDDFFLRAQSPGKATKQ